jgi:hypothetical protein
MRRPALKALPESELENPTLATVGKLLYNTVVRFLHDQTAAIIGSAFLVLMLWGYHGNLQLLGQFWSGWKGPGSDPATRAHIISGLPFDQEWISFFAGALIVVGIPCLLIRFVFQQPLSAYGLGLPPPGRRKLALISCSALFVVSMGGFYIGAQDASMRATYPLYRGTFTGTGQFLVYELGYLAFFVVIEFIFRGYLLFGLFQRKDRPDGDTATVSAPVFGYYAILISMLSYTAWHLGKPVPELWTTIIWGLAAGGVALAIRSIWPLVLIHWVLNIWLDLLIWKHW